MLNIKSVFIYWEIHCRYRKYERSMKMGAVHVTKDNYMKEVLQAEEPVLIDFWASWCGPCKMLMPVIEELADSQTNVKICKVNVDEEGDLAMQFGVKSIPTLVLMRQGERVDTMIGLHSKAEILEMLSK